MSNFLQKLHAWNMLMNPLRTLDKFLERGYLTSNKIRLNDVEIPTEYYLMIFVHQYTFVINRIKYAKKDPILRELVGIRTVAEAFFNTLIKQSELSGDTLVLPDRVNLTNKKIQSFIASFESFHKYKDINYLECLQGGMASHRSYMLLHPENPIHVFIGE